MAKSAVQPDVLVLGCHPSAFFAAALLKQTPGLKVVHCGLAEERYADRLMLLNPALFDLHPLLTDLKSELDLTPTNGLRFLADDPHISNQYVSPDVTAYIAGFKQLQTALQKKAGVSGGDGAAGLTIHSIDETGVDVTIGKTRSRPKVILLACSLPAEQARILGVPLGWERDVVRRYSFFRLKPAKAIPTPDKEDAIVSMSLELNATSNWAWLLRTPGCVQLAVEHPSGAADGQLPAKLIEHWAKVLASHGILKPIKIDPAAVATIDLPSAGALSQDLVANRTLLFGPAGGFYTACAEEIYPSCWSAVFAVNAAKAAIKEPFVQDALQQYRQRWGGSLGDYLRGPQQNLKFLLPLVYRNPTMAARLGEAILSGESVVR